jgi:uncharacterized protein (DUF3084 family)
MQPWERVWKPKFDFAYVKKFVAVAARDLYACMRSRDLRQKLGCQAAADSSGSRFAAQFQEEKMEGLITKSSKLGGLAGAVLALSLFVGCSNAPDPAQRAVNAANRADQAASRAEAASQKAQQAAASAQAAASRVEQAASDAKAAADRAEAIAAKTMASAPRRRAPSRHHHKAASDSGAAAAPSDSGAPAAAPATP